MDEEQLKSIVERIIGDGTQVEKNLTEFLRAQAVVEKERQAKLTKLIDDFWTI